MLTHIFKCFRQHGMAKYLFVSSFLIFFTACQGDSDSLLGEIPTETEAPTENEAPTETEEPNDDDNGEDEEGEEEGNEEDLPNTAPVAEDVSATLDMLQSQNILLIATDTENDDLDFTIVSAPSNGQLSGTPPEVNYQPSDGFVGTDSFTYQVNDGTDNSNTATVSITVRRINNTNTAKVFLMAGQSNMVGYGNVSDLIAIDSELSKTRDDVFVQSIIEPVKDFGPLAPGYGKNNSYYGVELKFGNVVGDLLSENVYLFKASRGGTTLNSVDDWRPPAHGGTAGNLYDKMMEGFSNFLQKNLDDESVDYEIAGFIWFQGYNDASSGIANNYEGHLRNLLSTVRSDFGISDLPVIIVQMNDVRGTPSDVVMAAQATVAAESEFNSLVITSDQRPYFHYGSSSYVTIGDRIAQATLPYLYKPVSIPDEYAATPGTILNIGSNSGVLVNDSGVSLSAELVQDTVHGSLSLNADGSFSYQPNTDYQGQDSFTYQTKVSNDVGNIAKVTLWVREESDPLVLHYTFDNADGESIVDKASGFEARILKGNITFGHPGKVGSSAYFARGVLHYLEDYPIAKPLDLHTDQDFSIALWLKLDAEGPLEQVMISNKYTADRGVGFSLATDSTGTGIKVFVGAYNHETHKATSRKFQVPSLGINDGGWHHVAVSFAFSSGVMTVFVDGDNVGEDRISNVVGEINQYESTIGNGSYGGGGPGFKGFMDDVRIYRSSLNQETLQPIINL